MQQCLNIAVVVLVSLQISILVLLSVSIDSSVIKLITHFSICIDLSLDFVFLYIDYYI